MPLLSHVRRYAARHALWEADTRVVAAVSGGSDSVAMLFLLHELHLRGELRLDRVAHLNHQIRPEADEDEAFCRALAARLDVAFSSSRVDVPARARVARRSLEVTGRHVRRQYLDDVRRSCGADVIATAHTADDQAETVLLRLLRGSGSRGLAGIAPRRDRRVRPVLAITRSQLRRELESRGEVWREDASNEDLANRRNRVRHELLPYLAEHFNPSVRRALTRSAEIARAENAVLERLAVAASTTLVECDDDTVTIDAEGLRCLPEGLQRRVVLHALAARRTRMPSLADVERAVTRMEHFRGKVVLVSTHDLPAEQPAGFNLDLPVPGWTQTNGGWVVEAERFDSPQRHLPRADVAQIDAAAVVGGLTVRNRKPGDRLRPVGLGGRKKLQDVLVDRKVKRSERDTVPIVTDASDRIVWVAGHVVSEEFRVTERTKGVIILKLRRV
jgi:tRNA(Ile)-lysidine synthase